MSPSDTSGRDTGRDAIAAFAHHLRVASEGTAAELRSTMLIPELAAGLPFTLYAVGMKGLAALSLVEGRVLSSDARVGPLGACVSCLLDVRVSTAKGERTGIVAVWCLPDGKAFVASMNSQWFN